MLKAEHLEKVKRISRLAGEGINFTQALLCSIALGEKLSPDFYNSRKVSQTFSGLRRYRFIRRVKNSSSSDYILTPKGEKRLQTIIIDEIEINRPKKWDSKWRIVIYDLPIRFKVTRNAFRWKLKELGFFQLQKSTWVYPFPCEREVMFVADFFGVQKYIEILEVNKISNDKKLKAHFG